MRSQVLSIAALASFAQLAGCTHDFEAPFAQSAGGASASSATGAPGVGAGGAGGASVATSASASTGASAQGGAGGGPPSCGNGVVEESEECDVGDDDDDDDGCSVGCIVQCAGIYEWKFDAAAVPSRKHCYYCNPYLDAAWETVVTGELCANWRKGAHLVTITEEKENDRVVTGGLEMTCIDSDGSGGAPAASLRANIGLYRDGGSFKWVSNEPFVYQSWGMGQPDARRNTIYVAIEKDGLWYEMKNGDHRTYICEWPPPP